MDDLVYRSLDGSRVEIAGDADLGPATSVGSGECISLGIRFTLTSVPKGLAEGLAKDPSIAKGMAMDGEYSIGGRPVIVGSGDQVPTPDSPPYMEHVNGVRRERRVHMAIWRGDLWNVHSIKHGGEQATLLAMLDEFHITETALGIVAEPKDPSDCPYLRGPVVLVNLLDLGILEVKQLTSRVARELPKHTGTPAAHAELYDLDSSEHRTALALVSDTALATLVCGESRTFDEVVAFASTLKVEWSTDTYGPP